MLKNGSGTQPKILIVDDNLTNQFVIQETIKNFGCTFMTVENGLLALEILEDHVFDLILMDIGMPQMDGLETTLEIRNHINKSLRKIPIIALTAYVMKEDQQNYRALGMDAFIPKPIDNQILFSTMQALLLKETQTGEPKMTMTENASYLDAPIISTAKLMENIGGLDDQTQQLVKSSFMADLEKCLSNIKIALETKDPELVEKQTHILKSITGTFGAMKLHFISDDLNILTRDTPEQIDWSIVELLISIGDETITAFKG